MAVATDRPPRWGRAIRLRMLLVLVALVAVVLATVNSRIVRQAEAVAAIRARGGRVAYDFEYVGGHFPKLKPPRAYPPGPEWLRSWIGDELFQDVVAIWVDPVSKGLGRSSQA